MCIETMDARSKHIKTGCFLRKTVKPGPKLRWRILRVSPGIDGAVKPCRGSTAVKATIRKHIHREQKRARLVKLAKIIGDDYEKEKQESVYEESLAAACLNRHPAGAMAPENTTQYLMSNIYDDMRTTDTQSTPAVYESSAHLYSESLSPNMVYAALDSGYESCLAFQQRDFEEMFDLHCNWDELV